MNTQRWVILEAWVRMGLRFRAVPHYFIDMELARLKNLRKLTV
jgi:hypothetical protein